MWLQNTGFGVNLCNESMTSDKRDSDQTNSHNINFSSRTIQMYNQLQNIWDNTSWIDKWRTYFGGKNVIDVGDRGILLIITKRQSQKIIRPRFRNDSSTKV